MDPSKPEAVRKEAPKEVEVKLAVPSAEAARRLLERAGFAESVPRAFEANTVLDTPERDLLRQGGLLRLRSYRDESILTFKGKAEMSAYKVRPEIETRVEDADALRMILENLGYEVTFRYEKFRTFFSRAGEAGHACLDETPIGAYLELEGPGAWIDATARELGFSPADYILLSYGTLYRNHCQAAGVEPSNMVFD